MVLGSLLEVIVLAGDLEYSWQCMVFDMMRIALQVSIDWCDLLNHMFWSLRWCVHVQAGFDRSSMVRLGCGFSSTLWMPASFCLPNLGDEFFFETLFCSLRFANNHMLCQRIVFGEQEYSWRWRAYDLDLGLDMTLRPANLLRWEFQFLRLAKTTPPTQRCRTRTTWKCTNDEPHLYPKFMALSHSVRGRFGPSQFVSCEGHFVQWANIFWEILYSYSQSVKFRKFTTSVFKERQTETVRASFAKASSFCPQSNQDGRGRTNIRRSGWSTL